MVIQVHLFITNLLKCQKIVTNVLLMLIFSKNSQKSKKMNPSLFSSANSFILKVGTPFFLIDLFWSFLFIFYPYKEIVYFFEKRSIFLSSTFYTVRYWWNFDDFSNIGSQTSKVEIDHCWIWNIPWTYRIDDSLHGNWG